MKNQFSMEFSLVAAFSSLSSLRFLMGPARVEIYENSWSCGRFGSEWRAVRGEIDINSQTNAEIRARMKIVKIQSVRQRETRESELHNQLGNQSGQRANISN